MTIDDVIIALENIIRECEAEEHPLGYFAALYLKVTRKVKTGIEAGEFDDGPRMERLDVIFASRYLDAYAAYRGGAPVTKSWQSAFVMGAQYWPIVLQHLLIGMNAHINLDLGIASAEVMKGKDIKALQGDFNRINTVLAALVGEVQEELAAIWPRLHWILRKSGRIDNFLTDFSMGAARDGAWRFALQLAAKNDPDWSAAIQQKDTEVNDVACLITDPGWLVGLAMKLIRLGERGTVREKIGWLNATSVKLEV